jgi:predicted ATPase/DNA-binding winged helix-turn-helix (wHTH) protein
MKIENFSGRHFRFSNYRLFPEFNYLCRENKVIHLSPTTLRVLVVLVEGYSSVVAKETFMTKVWFGSAIEENNLAIHIGILRKLFGGDAIKTIHGKGYQFNLAVEQVNSNAETLIALSAQREAASSQNNLPRPLAPMIGRAADLAAVMNRLDHYRLVTLAGPGGVGKTRLAVELGWEMAGRFSNRVRLIDLAPLTDPDLVATATATVLGVGADGTAASVETIAAAIGRSKMLLIFDNCEHLVGVAAALIAGLLEQAPGLSVLVTTQETLGIAAEQTYKLDPLALPPPASDHLDGFGAVDLFVARAVSADRRFRLDSTNKVSVLEICRGLDGIPLALEMAAARVPLLGIDGLHAGLHERLQMLKSRAPTGETRWRSLRAMLEWSHGLLDKVEKRILRRLAIFPGSFTMDAARAVAGEETDHWDFVEGFGRLVDRSLVTVMDSEPRRYRLLETLRFYAAEQLGESGESAATEERQARYFTGLFDQAGESWESMPDDKWLQLYGPEIDNVRAALNWALAAPERASLGIALAGNAASLWLDLGFVVEGRHFVDRFLDLLDQDTPLPGAARLFLCAGYMWRTDSGRAIALIEQSVAFLRHLGDRLNLGSVLALAGNHYFFLGRTTDAELALDEARAILAGSKRWKSQLLVMRFFSKIARIKNDPADAVRHLTCARVLAWQMKDGKQESLCMMSLGEVEFLRGAIDSAIEYVKAAIDGIRAARLSGLHLANALNNLASYLMVRNDHRDARLSAREALPLIIEEGGIVLRNCLQLWALFGAGEGRHREAARLIGWVDCECDKTGEIRDYTERMIRDRLSAVLESQLAAGEIASLAAEGAHWSEAAAIAFVRDEIVSHLQPELPSSVFEAQTIALEGSHSRSSGLQAALLPARIN